MVPIQAEAVQPIGVVVLVVAVLAAEVQAVAALEERSHPSHLFSVRGREFLSLLSAYPLPGEMGFDEKLGTIWCELHSHDREYKRVGLGGHVLRGCRSNEIAIKG